ncbi:MAG: hypothetical protein IKW57_04210 [Alphaproteobacteria bacterium]|nr:hypothetical protein [Alphaproteobacteria bacterium]
MNKNTWYTICIIMLGLAVLPIMPYGYYMLLRVVICGVCLWQIISEYNKKATLPVGLCLIALLYNPIFSISLTRPVWTIFNVATLVYFLSVMKKD